MRTYPLLQSQLGVLVQSLQHPESTQYNVPSYIYIPLKIGKERLINAMHTFVQSFPVFRTRFVIGEGGDVRQWCDMSLQIPIASRKCTEAELQAYIKDGFIRPFDLFGNEPLFRMEVIETEKNFCMLTDGHHSVIDGMSFASILTKAFADILQGESIEPQDTEYGMYQAAEDEVASFETPLYQRAKDYYAKKFDGLEMVRLSRSQRGIMGKMGRSSAFVSRSLCDQWCQEHGVSVNLLFQAAFSHTIAVLTRQDRVAYFTVNHGRMDKRLRNSVGMYVRSVPFLADGSGDPSAIEYIKRLRVELMSTIRYGIYPFSHFCMDLGVTPGVMFNFQAIANMEEHVLLKDIELFVVQPVREEIDADAGVLIFYKGDDYEIRVESSLAMNDQATLQMFANAISHVVCQMVAHPDVPLSQIGLVSQEEQRSLIELGAGKRIEIDASKTYMDYFMQRAAACPDALAVADDAGTLSYSQLDRHSDLIANRLLAAGVMPRDFVGIMIERTREFPVCVFGIHKAGAAYLPLDPEYPVERLRYMLEDSGTRILLATHSVLEVMQLNESFFNGVIVFLDDIDWELEAAAYQPVNRCKPDGYAYIIYTSGSTGRPKGTVLHQKGLLNYIFSTIDELELTAEDRISSHRSFSFDSHIEDLYAILLLGGSLHIMPEYIRKDLQAIRDFIVRHHVTGGGYTTSVAKLLVNNFDIPLQYISAVGERLTGVVSRKFEIYNFYGPTECTDHVTVHRLKKNHDYVNIPIGHVVANCWCFIVDAHGHLLPRGASGELCVAGIQVGVGYWNKLDLTEDKFVSCPFVSANIDGSPVRMYYTGDLCRWNDDGELEFIGRIDNQLKIRGFRIELGEIENHASKFTGICQAVAAVVTVDGNDILCLYYTADHDIDKIALRDYLVHFLAEYMVPMAYMQLDNLPHLPNGKVDRQHLPVPKMQQNEAVAPETDLEKQLFDLVQRQLGNKNFGVTTDLISIGLTSLGAMRLSIAVGSKLNLRLTANDILSTPTIRQLADIAGKRQTGDIVDLEVLHKDQDYYPLTENQRGVYIDWELNRTTTQYNQPTAFRLNHFDAERLADALRQVVDAHSYLKTRLAFHDGDVMQQRYDDALAEVTVIQLEHKPDQSFFQSRVRPFNLFDDNLYRLEVYQCNDAVYLFKDFHHIICDGLSVSIFFQDLMSVYNGGAVEKERVTAFDFALYEQSQRSADRFQEAADYFASLLEGAEAASFPHSVHLDDKDHRSMLLACGIVKRKSVDEACHRIGVTVSSYFQTVVTQVLHRLTRQEHIALATVSGSRPMAQMERMIGMFVKTLPLVSEVSAPTRPFADVARQMHHQSIDTLAYDFYPLTSIVGQSGVRPEILFAFNSGLYDSVSAYLDTDVELMNLELDTPKMPIELMVFDDGKEDYKLYLSYDTQLYNRTDIQTFARAVTVYAQQAVKDGICLGDIELTTAEERKSLIQLGAGDHLDIDSSMTFVKAFETCAGRVADHIAVVDAEGSFTYHELSRCSDILAHRLIACGVRPNDFVAVMLPRVKEYVMALLAIHKAGAAFVPIDLELPEQRKKYMLDNCKTKVLVDCEFLAETDFSAEASSIDLSTSEGLAYMIYTSGSTGNPKGTMLHQAGLWNMIQNYIHMVKMTADDHVAGHRSFSFDAHVDDVFPILTLGGPLYIMPELIRRDLSAIRQFLLKYRITILGLTTSMGVLLNRTFPDIPLRILAIGGEQLHDIYSDCYTIFNCYGPTECTNDVTSFKIEPGTRLDSVPIGRPVINSHIFLTDPLGKLVPRGTVGELCFAGIQVGKGYCQLPELTASVFTDCPFLPLHANGKPVPMYYTHDLCRWNEEGQFEFLGRKDYQVKLRGYRIELSEIESCASRFNGIRLTAAKVIDGQYICLYYTANAHIEIEELKQFLAYNLASYMLPTTYMQLDDMPFGSSGKIDRHRLPQPAFHPCFENVSPRTEKESVLLKIAREKLKRNDFGVTDDLTDLGITSIDAISMAAMAEDKGIRISVNDLMRSHTIESACSEHAQPGYWVNGYESDKPVLIVPHGIIFTASMNGKFRQWCQYFSIYAIEPIDEHADRLFPDGDFMTMIDFYTEMLDHDIPVTESVFGFVGYSYGGELAYWLAVHWQQLRGVKANVYLGDTQIYRPEEIQHDADAGQTVIEYAQNHQADIEAIGIDAGDSFQAEQILAIAVKKLNMVKRLSRSDDLPLYDGRVILFKALLDNNSVNKNVELWHKVASQLETVDIDDNHLNFVISDKYIGVVTERLLHDLNKQK